MENRPLFVLLLSAFSTYGANDYKVQPISEIRFKWANSPFWDVSNQVLYFTDISEGLINSYKPSTKRLCSAKIVNKPNCSVSLIIPFEEEKDKFVVTIKNTVNKLTWNSRSRRAGKPVLIATLNNNSSIDAHTGKPDPKGRLWVGTFGPFHKNSSGGVEPDFDAGSVYMLTGGGNVITKIANISIPDGLAWNADKTKFYFVNCWKQRIESFDYDNESGDISNMRVIFDTKKNAVGGLPTGMTIDTEGKLWISQFFSGKVIQINPDSGELLKTIDLPAKELTNLAFGGKNLDVLYVTSARILEYASPPTEYSGQVYAVTGLMNSGKPVKGYTPQKITAI